MKTTLFFSLFLFGLGGIGSEARAQTGTFARTGSMISPRFGHTATLLPDGRVLISGGFTACVIGSGALCGKPDGDELYDPATGTFTAKGSTGIAFPEGVVLLPDGKPATLTDSTVLLNDGRVLLIGGVYGAELYDPASATFNPVANWPGLDFRGGDAATSSYWYPVLLADGKVLLAPYDSISGCKIYDPASGTFHLTGALGYFLGVPIGRCF